jgi:small GTP-binding protein
MMDESNSSRDMARILKIVIVGDSGVGKTQLLNKFSCNEFDLESKSTIGVNFLTKFVEKQDVTGGGYKLQLWDTAGQERYRAITAAYYRGALGILFCYDSTKKSTFENIAKWLHEFKENNGTSNVKMALISTKNDIKHLREVTTEASKKYAMENNMLFFETSSLTGEGVTNTINSVVYEISDMIEQHSTPVTENKPGDNKIIIRRVGDPEIKKKKCC